MAEKKRIKLENPTCKKEFAAQPMEFYMDKERECGIGLFRTDGLQGFSAVLKQRFSDFLVNEIDLDGNVIRLKNLEGKEPEKAEEMLDEEDIQQQLMDTVGEEFLQRLSALVAQEHLLTKSFDDKPMRTTVHKLFKVYESGKYCTTTVGDSIQVSLSSNMSHNDRARSQRANRRDNPPFCLFHLYKENQDTMAVIQRIARILKMKPNAFSFAGTKDKRGVTVQQVTAERVLASRLAQLNKPGMTGFVLGDFRDVKMEDSQQNLEDNMKALKSNGFINYFGMQRFGTTSIGTHEIGRKILAGRFEDAVNAILCSRKDDPTFLLDARKAWEEKDYEKAFGLFPSRYVAERQILKALQHRPGKYFAALSQIPRNLKLMYLHAYQSWFWNKMTSKRLEEYGVEVVMGDLVIDINAPTEKSAVGGRDRPAIRCIKTEDEAKAFTIFDVVLPLPGYAIEYPSNSIGELYQALLNEEGWDPRDKRNGAERELALPGDYRCIMAVPKNLEWKLYRYNDEMQPLSQTDLDIMNSHPEPANVEDGKWLAVVVSFDLESSQYATMALRELMRTPTSPDFQATLNTSSLLEHEE